MPQLPPVTKAFLLACVGLFCLPFVLPPTYAFVPQQWLALWPLQSGLFYPWQLVTYAFLHGGVFHLFFNMLGLWMFGPELERVWGGKRYTAILVASTLSAALVQLLVTTMLGSNSPTIGASGALYGLLLSFGMLFPDRIIVPLIPPIPMKAKYFVAIFGCLELYWGYTNTDGVAHFAHLGGMLGAYLLIRYWRTARRR